MTEAQRITFIHDDRIPKWEDVRRQLRANPRYAADFPTAFNDCKAGIALCREIKAGQSHAD